MNELVKKIYEIAKTGMEDSINHLETELSKIRAGKANPSMLDGIQIDYYGQKVPLSQAANINTQDARTIIIQPWEKSLLVVIEKAVQAANLGFNPQNDGIIIRILVPPLTEERRKDLVKKAKQEVEDAKVGLRTTRREALEALKKLSKSDLPEDEAKDAETKIQTLTDQHSQKCDKHLETKEKEILTV